MPIFRLLQTDFWKALWPKLRAYLKPYLYEFRSRARGVALTVLTSVWLLGFAAAALSLWAFSWLSVQVFRPTTEAFDVTVLRAIETLHAPWLDRLIVHLTGLGDPTVISIVSIGFALWWLARGAWKRSLVLAIAVGGGSGLNALLKLQFSRARPELWERIIDARFYSFPSGHAMMSFITYGSIGYFLLRRFPRQRWQIAIATALVVLSIGFTRLYLGVHWLTDVLAGYAAGLVWLSVCIVVWEALDRRRWNEPTSIQATRESDAEDAESVAFGDR